MGHFASQLLRLIVTHRLDDRYPEFRRIRWLLEHNMLSEPASRAQLFAAEGCVESLRDRPVYLHRAPTAEQLYKAGKPQIEIASLVEAPDLRCGLHLDGPFHAVFLGTTNAGKTTAMRRLILAVHEWNQRHPDDRIVIICLDRKAGDYADIPDPLGRDVCLHFSVDTYLRLALQKPVGVPVNTWVNVVATLFTARTGLIASWVTLANIIRWLLEALNHPATNPDDLRWPDWQLILDVCSKSPETTFSAKAEYLRSLRQMLSGLTQASGDLFRAFRGLDVERDLIDKGKSAVIAMPTLLPSWLRQFVCDLLISQVLVGRMHRAERTSKVNCIFLVDEADADCSQAAEDAFADGMPPISSVARWGRELGIGVCPGLSGLGFASRHLLADIAYVFSFRLKDARCVREARETLMLPNGADAILPALGGGECLVRTDSWPHAMLAQVDYVAPCRDARPRYDKNEYVPAQRLDELPDVQTALARKRASHGRDERDQKQSLPKGARELLDLASLDPYWPVNRHWAKTGKEPSPRAQLMARKRLEDEQFAVFKEPRIGRANVLLTELQTAGWKYLGKKAPANTGNGGLVHRHFAQWIRMVGEQRGYEKSRCEWTVPDTGHRVDAAWRVDGEWHVFEVVSECEDNLPSHIKTCFEKPNVVSTLNVVAAQLKDLRRLEKRIKADTSLAPFADRLKFKPVEAFMRELWP